ncbi:VIT1/CCC1 transporter family protein [Aurantimicrobium minutum]|uniref:VIT1/CCC1 transporter family protein n=1 Tax=Aurantimicrobium minutum TaxID=708131 RepID=UPI0024742360|nr:VIT family protein [Aurantimicrobium minutum]MDH6255065.1 VIT1/CCC1 family predicted Fe2+/Mn2+ transporter [Aurantimicrobium minutum]
MPESVHAQGFEPHDAASNSKLNWLRAGVLGANDGIVSIAALMVGVAAATTDPAALLLTGVAGLSAGAISMALGEYVSVSSQRDSEKAWINKERRELEEFPEEELEELVALYEAQGLKPATARQVAVEMTEVDALKTHLDIELGINQEELTNPLHAAISSAIAFFAGAILPLLAVLLVPGDAKIPSTVAASLIALALTGGVGAYIGGAPVPRAILRVTIGGAAALAVTYFIGSLLGSGTAI